MRHLVEDLLLLARLDEGRRSSAEPVELVTAGRRRRPRRPWPWAHGGRSRSEADQPVEVIGDAGRLRQVFDNLLANVRAHTPPGTTSTVSVARGGRRRGGVGGRRRSRASGPSTAAHVFERFYRADPSRSRRSAGLASGSPSWRPSSPPTAARVLAGDAPSGGAMIVIRLPAPAGGGSSGPREGREPARCPACRWPAERHRPFARPPSHAKLCGGPKGSTGGAQQRAAHSSHEQRRGPSEHRPAHDGAAVQDVEIVVPVYNEEPSSRRACSRLRAYLDGSFPFPPSSPSPTTPAPTAPGRSPAGWPGQIPGVRAVRLAREGPGPGAAGRLVGQRRRRGGLHGRRPVHRPRRAAPPGGPACSPVTATWPSGPGWPAALRWSAGPKRELISRRYNLLVRATLHNGSPTPSAASRPCGPTWPGPCCRWSKTTSWFFDTELLVLAERNGPAHPRGAGRLGRRPRLAGRDTPHRPRRSPRDLAVDPRAPGERSPARRHPRPATGAQRRADPLRRRGRRQHDRLPDPLRGPAAGPRSVSGQPGGPRALHGGQHRSPTAG